MHGPLRLGQDCPAVTFNPALLAAWISGFMPLESGPIWIPAAASHYHVSGVAIGMVATMQFAVSAVTAQFLAPYLSRFPPRGPLLAGMSGILLACLISAIVELGFTGFIALRVLDGACSGLCIATVGMLTSRTRRPARAFGGLQLGQILANTVLFGLSAKMVGHFGVAGVYAVIAPGALLAILVVAVSRPWQSLRQQGMRRRREAGAPPIPIMRLGLACSGIALIYCAFVGLVTNAQGFGAHAGLNFAQVGLVLAISAPSAAIGALLATALAGRVAARALVAAAAVGALAFGLILAWDATTFVMLTVGICGFILSLYIGFPTIFAGVGQLETTGTAAAAAQASQLVGLAIGPTAGAIIAHGSISALGLAVAIAASIGTLASGAAILAWRPIALRITPDGDARIITP